MYQGRIKSGREQDWIGRVGSLKARIASHCSPIASVPPLLFHVHANNPRADSFAWWNAQLGPNVGYSSISSSNNIMNVSNGSRDTYYRIGPGDSEPTDQPGTTRLRLLPC